MVLNFKKYGSGHPLIILHGMFGMLDNWHSLARKFAEHFEVYLVDQRNHGKSPHSDEMDYYVMANDLGEFMKQNDIDSAFIIGHSMGGKTAMQFAVENNHKVDKLIVVDISPKKYEPGHQEIFDALFSVNLEEIESRKEAEAKIAETIEEPGVRQFLLKNLDRKGKKYQWKANLNIIHKNYLDIIGNSLGPYDEFGGPTMFIKGGNSDRYIDIDDWGEIVGHFPKALLETVEDAGHWVHAEKPEELYELVLGFL